ncbi:TonB-dependent receptor domain-containing protein [Paracoccus saliphilus]|uniref:Hemoglobin/transferrin/lactoferrin receptor protein n=1 Tax=Paracoccus saliphilus TaxID=405559 RepID=A0AA46A3Y4_9RHOB|nr:TonB-dependent receptor [Paracoccus saliphilus]WCR03367.1 TonB-dependent receptor [Paracoccus saliphilus]SIS52314.1 hemoglobin/transferrin/lactoferrin receptor protein [Paracoccus saliphilus]
MPKFTRAVLALSTATLPTIVQAQQITLDPITLYATDEYVIGQVEVDEDDLKAAENGGLADLFRSEPGVSVDGGIALTERVYVNGIDQEQMAVTIDGALQNNRMWHHTTTNLIDPGLLKAARVDAGVAPADAGPDALAGSIEYETKSALDLLEDGQNFGGKLTTGYASNGERATGALTLYGRQGPVDALLYAKRATGDDYEGGDGKTVKYTGADLSSYMVKLGAEANGWRFEYGGMQVQDDSLRPFRPNVTDYTYRPSAPRYFDMTQTTHTLKVGRSEAAEGLFNPELLLSSSEGKQTAEEVSSDDPLWTNAVSDTKSAILQNHSRFGQTEVTAGIDLHNRTSSADDYWGSGAIHGFQEESHNTGLFVQARGSAGQFDFSSGLRYDWNRFNGTQGEEFKTDGASANANVTWNATDALSFDAGYSTVFGGIPVDYSFNQWAPHPFSEQPRPTRSQNMILGANWSQNGTTINAEYFRTKVGNARDTASRRTDGPSPYYNGHAYYFISEAKEIRSQGWRLSLGQNWTGGSATLRYSDIEMEVDGKAPTSLDLQGFGTIPGRVLTLDARHQVTRDLTFGGVIEHAFGMSHQGVDPDDEPRRDFEAYTLVNVYGEYKPARYENLTIRAEINNLFDEDYVDRASFGGDYEFVIPQKEPGRSIALTANFTF